MSTPFEEPTIHELVTRLAELERAHACLQEELTHVRAEQAPAAEEQTSTQTRTHPERSSRRKVLTTGLGVAVATVGVGTMLELSGGTALAKPPAPGVFASSVAGTPAVKATGTNGADGVDATSDSGTGVSATSTSGIGLIATSSSGLAGHFVGNVKLDNALTVAGTLSSGAGSFASSVAGTPAVKATGTNGADGVDASSDSGTGVSAFSTSGTGLVAISSSGTGLVGESGSGTGLLATSSSGLAGHFVGNVKLDNALTVAGTLSSGAGTFASSVSGTPSIKATGTNGADGVDAFSDSGTGVSATSSSGTGLRAQSSSGIGMHAVGGGASPGSPPIGFTEMAVFAEGGPHTGVIATSSNVTAVVGESGSGIGVFGESSSGTGVFGQSSTGLAGFFEGDVQVNGNFSATGTKSFVQAHPTDPSREIVYVALEGGEAGTYVRGTGQLVNGKAVLALPEHFGLVTNNEGLTVQFAPRGEWLQLYLVELDPAQIVVREAQGKSGAFDYLIHGVRRGYEQHEVIRTKR